MLSYQHAYHAGGPADVHKHAALAWMLDYLCRKPKPLSYIETHAGRGLYDLGGTEAAKTGEARAGWERLAGRLDPDHPLHRAVARVRAEAGARAYPGSPRVAAALLREGDRIDLAELHPGEHAALEAAMAGTGGRVHRRDGMEFALASVPPEPRRGLMLIDPSFEVKAEYDRLPGQIAGLHRRWGVGVIVLWYPILRRAAHRGMVAELRERLPGGQVFEAPFPPAREGHGMVGSGLFVLNAPWGFEAEAARLATLLAASTGPG